jgi:predicted alpha/beta hydrolase family esterase
MKKEKKKQVVVIHGGEAFNSYKDYLSFLNKETVDLEDLSRKNWKHSLQDKLGRSFEVIQPRMPNSLNAKYKEWKIWFEKFIPYIKPNVLLIGHSLGGIFLAKYLSENIFPKKIRAVFLIAAPYNIGKEYPIGDFKHKTDFKKFSNQVKEIYLYHSKNDTVVPFQDLEKYKKLLPNAQAIVFKNKGHFSTDIKEFPELIKKIKSIN